MGIPGPPMSSRRRPPGSSDEVHLNVKEHLDAHNNIRAYKCSVCHCKDFIFQKDLIHHKEKHQVEEILARGATNPYIRVNASGNYVIPRPHPILDNEQMNTNNTEAIQVNAASEIEVIEVEINRETVHNLVSDKEDDEMETEIGPASDNDHENMTTQDQNTQAEVTGLVEVEDEMNTESELENCARGNQNVKNGMDTRSALAIIPEPEVPNSSASKSKQKVRKSTGKRKVRSKKPFTNCQLCSVVLEQPVDPYSLRDGHIFYPACCQSCKTKFDDPDFHIVFRTEYHKKTYRCGMCSLLNNTLPLANRHLRLHTREKPCIVKATKNCSLVDVAGKSSGVKADAAMKSSEVGADAARKPSRAVADVARKPIRAGARPHPMRDNEEDEINAGAQVRVHSDIEEIEINGATVHSSTYKDEEMDTGIVRVENLASDNEHDSPATESAQVELTNDEQEDEVNTKRVKLEKPVRDNENHEIDTGIAQIASAQTVLAQIVSAPAIIPKREVPSSSASKSKQKVWGWKTKRKVQRNTKPFTNCQLCSAVLESPVDPDSLRERNIIYPACCQSCKTKRDDLDLRIDIKTSYPNEKIYNCGICSTPNKARSLAIRHLRLHTRDKPYALKASKDFYIIKVKWNPTRARSTRVKSELTKVEHEQNDDKEAESSSAPSTPNTISLQSANPTDISSRTRAKSQLSSALTTPAVDTVLSPKPAFQSRKVLRGQKKLKGKLDGAGAVGTKILKCLHPGCGKRFKSKRLLEAHSGGHVLNIGAIWRKKSSRRGQRPNHGR